MLARPFRYVAIHKTRPVELPPFKVSVSTGSAVQNTDVARRVNVANVAQTRLKVRNVVPRSRRAVRDKTLARKERRSVSAHPPQICRYTERPVRAQPFYVAAVRLVVRPVPSFSALQRRPITSHQLRLVRHCGS